jgi:hypothetical protein
MMIHAPKPEEQMPQDEQIFLLKKKKGVPKWVQVILVLIVSVFGVLITIVFPVDSWKLWIGNLASR